MKLDDVKEMFKAWLDKKGLKIRCKIFIMIIMMIGMLELPVKAQVKLEVAHWWTSKAETKAISVIKQHFEKAGYTWIDSGVIGGAGGPMVEVLKDRLATGNPPGAVQALMGYHLWQWAERDVLTSLNEIAQHEQWDDILPAIVKNMVTYQGNYVAVPVNLHRVNWMWTNSEIFRKAQAEIPHTWDEFFISAEKIRNAGFVPVAIGEDPWQVATLFDSVALGVGNVSFYKKAFMELDLKTIQSPTMIKVFNIMRKIRSYANEERNEITWDMAASMVMNGQAAMQFMGDWVKGEILVVGQIPGKDIGCFPVPETQNMFIADTDTFAMFQVKDKDIQHAQEILAKTILEPDVQELFNLYKGSIPVRMDLDLTKFDACGQISGKDFRASEANGTLVPSFALGLATPPEVREVMLDLINTHFDSDMSAEEAVKKLAALVKAAK